MLMTPMLSGGLAKGLGSLGGGKFGISGKDAGSMFSRVAIAGVIGGVGARISGGNFWSGFQTGAFSRLFNTEAHGDGYFARRSALIKDYFNGVRDSVSKWWGENRGYTAEIANNYAGLAGTTAGLLAWGGRAPGPQQIPINAGALIIGATAYAAKEIAYYASPPSTETLVLDSYLMLNEEVVGSFHPAAGLIIGGVHNALKP